MRRLSLMLAIGLSACRSPSDGQFACPPPERYGPPGMGCDPDGLCRAPGVYDAGPAPEVDAGPSDGGSLETGLCAGAPVGSVCRAANGACDLAEVCDGTASDCPPDTYANEGTLCREAAGECDAVEHCTGESAACPEDLFRPSGDVCRPATHVVCDYTERCSGEAAECPGDIYAATGEPCGSQRCCWGGDCEACAGIPLAPPE